ASASNRREVVRDSETVALLDSVVVLRVGKGHRRDPRIHEVVQVDPGKTLREDELDAEEHRGDGGVLAGRALTVVVPRHDDSAARLLRPRREGRVDVLEHMFREGRDVRTEREDLRACRYDVVRRDVVPEADQDLAFEGVLGRVRDGQGADVRAPDDRDRTAILWRPFEPRRIDRVLRRLLEGWQLPQVPGIGNFPFKRRRRRGLWAAQIYEVVRRPAPSLEIAVERADGGAVGRRGEPHADTRSAGHLELAEARLDELRHKTDRQHEEQRLARAGRDRDRDSWRDALVVERVRDDAQVPERRIHAAPDRDLRDL